MVSKRARTLGLVLASLLLCAAAEKEDAPSRPPPPAPQEKVVETRHTVRIAGEPVAYLARAGTLLLRNEKGEPRGSVFFVSYTREGSGDPGTRPIAFCFNGGPGASAVWLHLGALGPRRIALAPEGLSAEAPPYVLEDNGDSLLDVADLVFIDPVSTGYSRATPGEDPRQFHGVDRDLDAMGEFVRLYTTRYGRWRCPKFLAGESYGTTRAAELAGHLQDRYGLYVNGLLLISSVLDFQTISFDPGNDLPYVLYLPTYTAVAWYHGKLSGELESDRARALEEAKAFAAGPYAAALFRGSKLTSRERREVAERLARLAGLDPAVVEREDLRISLFDFGRELLKEEGRLVGRFDGRVSGHAPDASGRGWYDPSYEAIQGAFSAGANDYLRAELGYESDLVYGVLVPEKVQPWDFASDNRYLNVASALQTTMTQLPFLKVFVANGYYDLSTPYFATEYTFDHLEENLRKNVTLAYYDAGHMLYTHRPSLAKLKKDLAEFIKRTVNREW